MNKISKNNIINFPNDISQEEKEIEAILFAAEEPLDEETIKYLKFSYRYNSLI